MILSFQNRKVSDVPESVGKIVLGIQEDQHMKKQISSDI